MNRILLFIILIIGTIFSIHSVSYAISRVFPVDKPEITISSEDGDGRITGLIIDKTNNEVITSAIVTIEKSGYKKVYVSDFQGKYLFDDLTSGEYKITVSRLGYQTQTVDVSINSGEIKSINIYLSEAKLEIETVNVTATRTELTLQNTPSSLSTISAEEIRNRNSLTFDQVLEKIQGITVNRTSGINLSSLSIRGSSDVAGGGIGNRVLLLLDGRPSLTGDSKGALWSLIPVSIIERTEVVKGAFSALYGSSAIGGVINVITKKPTYKPFTVINLSSGFYQKLPDSLKYSDKLMLFKAADIVHSNTLGKFSYLVNLNYRQNDGYAQQTEFEFYSGIAKMTYDLFSNRDLEVTLQYTKSESGYPHYWRKDPNTYAQPYQVSPQLLNDKIYKETQSFDIQYRAIPNSKSKYGTRFYYYKLFSQSDYNPINPVTIQYGTAGQIFSTFITSYNFGNISQVDFLIGENNFLTAGFDAQWNVVRSTPESILYGNQQQYNLGIFAQDQIKLINSPKSDNPVLTSTVAGRLDYNKFIGGSEVFQISPKLSFVYSPVTNNKIFENTHYRALVGRAFRSPSIAELYFKKELFGGFDFIYNPNLKPEEMISAEIGFRKQYQNRFNVDFAYFINLYDNLIQYVNISTNVLGPFQVQNIAKAQISGIEASMDYSHEFKIGSKVIDYRFEVNYTYMDAKDLSANRKDDFLPYKPKHLFGFGINIGFEGFNLNTTGRYVSKIDEVIFYKYEEPDSYFLLDAKLSKSFNNGLSIFVAVNNIFDKFYQELERIAAPNRNFTGGISFSF